MSQTQRIQTSLKSVPCVSLKYADTQTVCQPLSAWNKNKHQFTNWCSVLFIQTSEVTLDAMRAHCPTAPLGYTSPSGTKSSCVVNGEGWAVSCWVRVTTPEHIVSHTQGQRHNTLQPLPQERPPCSHHRVPFRASHPELICDCSLIHTSLTTSFRSFSYPSSIHLSIHSLINLSIQSSIHPSIHPLNQPVCTPISALDNATVAVSSFDSHTLSY